IPDRVADPEDDLVRADRKEGRRLRSSRPGLGAGPGWLSIRRSDNAPADFFVLMTVVVVGLPAMPA
ncbi:hypothetical protein, partial [Stenotrophomonas maltophilia]|uniref:hypothetical protein n=1 Tax=Stenotrophomonas maltophilia TaxID=40324 RepID=UPI001952EC39